MIDEMIRVLAAPDFENEEERRQANLLNIISLTQAVAALISILIIYVTVPNNLKIIVAGGIFLLLATNSQIFLRLKKTRLSSILLISGDWILTTLIIYDMGGVLHPLVNIYFVILIINIFLFGGRSTIVISGITILTLFTLWITNLAENTSTVQVTIQETWGTVSILLIFTTILLYFGMDNLNQALSRSYKKQVLLAKNNQKLATAQISIEEEFTSRTASLKQRSDYLEAAIEVGRAAASILESDELIRKVVQLIQAHFNLYYVGLFLVDPDGEWAILKAGTGEAGKALQEREHRIRIGDGMVGWSIENAKPRIAVQVKDDSIRLKTPELEATHSEAALPLRSRGKVIGALTVQSAQLHTFDEDMIEVLQIMADQVATAIDNAHLFAESQTALESVRQSYDEFSQRSWNELLRTRSELGFRYQGKEILPIEGEWQPELIEAAQSGQRLEISEPDKASLTIPIRVRNQVVGALKFRKDGQGKKWTPDEMSLLETLTDQLGVALESARLYEETQRRAERERLASEISAKLRASNDQQTILQTAVQELRRALQANRAQVMLQPHDTADQSENSDHNGNVRER